MLLFLLNYCIFISFFKWTLSYIVPTYLYAQTSYFQKYHKKFGPFLACIYKVDIPWYDEPKRYSSRNAISISITSTRLHSLLMFI